MEHKNRAVHQTSADICTTGMMYAPKHLVYVQSAGIGDVCEDSWVYECALSITASRKLSFLFADLNEFLNMLQLRGVCNGANQTLPVCRITLLRAPAMILRFQVLKKFWRD